MTLPQSGLQVIRREIRSGVSDLVGLYPYSMCRDIAALEGADDQAALRATGAVSLSFVADPFEAETVRAALGHWRVCRRFKTQFIIDLAGDWRNARTKNTRRYVRKGYETQTTEITAGSRHFAPRFWALYQNSIRRHRITGIQRMSEAIIADQMAVSGLFLTVARTGGVVNGAMMSFIQESHVNAHLICFDDKQNAQYTSYVLIDAAAAHAKTLQCRWFNIGGPAGLDDNPNDGLFQFKRRWTKSTRATMLCGQVLDAAVYRTLCAEVGARQSDYFPAYRTPGLPFEWRPFL